MINLVNENDVFFFSPDSEEGEENPTMFLITLMSAKEHHSYEARMSKNMKIKGKGRKAAVNFDEVEQQKLRMSVLLQHIKEIRNIPNPDAIKDMLPVVTEEPIVRQILDKLPPDVFGELFDSILDGSHLPLATERD